MQGVNLAGMVLLGEGSPTEFALGAQLRYTRLDYPELTVMSSSGVAGDRWTPTENYFGITVAGDVRWKNGFSAGIGGTVKRWSADYGAMADRDGKGDVVAFDVGGNVSFRTTASSGWQTTISLGAAVTNIGDEFDDPWAFSPEGLRRSTQQRANYGLSVRTAGNKKPILDTEVPEVVLTFNVDWNDPTYDPEYVSYFVRRNVFRVGGEVAVWQVLFLRAGLEKEDGVDHTVVQAGAGLGLPSKWFIVRIDYAVYPLEFLGGEARIEKRDKKFTIVFGIPFRSS